MHVAAQARDCLSDIRPSKNVEEEKSSYYGAVLAVFIRRGRSCPRDGRRDRTGVVHDLAVQLVEARQQIADVGSLVELESFLLLVMHDGHAQHADRAAKVLDVESGSECRLELLGPLRVTAENQHVIHIDGNVDHESGSDKRIASAVTFQLM